MTAVPLWAGNAAQPLEWSCLCWLMAAERACIHQGREVLLDSLVCMVPDVFADDGAGHHRLGVCHVGQHQLQDLQSGGGIVAICPNSVAWQLRSWQKGASV